MSEWLPISELFNFEKGTLQSSKCTAGDFTFITASAEWKTHDTYTHETEALVFAMAASGSLGRTHYVNGKFIASDLCFILTPKTDKKIDLAFYFRIFNFIREDIVKKTATGSSKLAINQSNFGNYKLPYFDFEHQLLFREKIDKISDIKNGLSSGFLDQKTYLIKLRLAILQEAIEGKLTVDWRVNNPVYLGDPNTDAQALLATIKTEKQKLIADGKIKKEKLLAPINPDNVPFVLPDGWVWVRLGEITLYSEAGKSFLCTEREIHNEEWGVVKVSSVSWGEFRERENKLYSKEEPENIKYKINIGDFLISRANTTELVGRSVIVRELSRNLLLSDKIIRFVFSFEIIKELSNRFNTSIYARNYFESRATGSSPSMKNVNRSDMELLVIPLPPLAEQQAIVERVDRLLNHINALEQQVTERKHHAEQLMQAVLKEAFAG